MPTFSKKFTHRATAKGGRFTITDYPVGAECPAGVEAEARKAGALVNAPATPVTNPTKLDAVAKEPDAKTGKIAFEG